MIGLALNQMRTADSDRAWVSDNSLLGDLSLHIWGRAVPLVLAGSLSPCRCLRFTSGWPTTHELGCFRGAKALIRDDTPGPSVMRPAGTLIIGFNRVPVFDCKD